jgi:outer membrane protein OmpA-like peptidoglycan-associated protein/Tol biopolymer transport system component
MRTSMRLLFFSFLALLATTCLLSQELSTGSNRAARFFRSGVQQFEVLNYEEAVGLFKQAISADRNFHEAYLLAGDVYFEMKEYRKAIEYFQGAVSLDPDFFPMVYFNMGNAWIALGEYENARDSYGRLALHPGVTARYREVTVRKIMNCDFAINAIQNPVPFNPVDIGPAINTADDEYWPTLTADEQTLIFTRQIKKNPAGRRLPGNLKEDFYISYRKDDEWSVARNIGPPLNSELNEGAPSVTADGRLIFFTACNREGGLGSCDIYFAERLGNKWGEPFNMGSPVNTSDWDAQPSISPDGKTLYFSSSRRGGRGKMDIWYTRQDEGGKWGIPVNLGETINTEGNEMSPFIHLDNRTLYFSSDGHTGMGGYDLFVSRRDENGNWGEPENLGYPLNTHFDEIGLTVNARGDKGYFASDRMGGEVKDIYTFDLHPDVRPLEVSYLKGTVYDALSQRRLGADFEIIDLLTAEPVIGSFSDPGTGEFLVPITTGRDYALNVSRKGYLFYSDHLSLGGFAHQTDPYLKDIPLYPIKEGEKTILRNIFFEFDSYELKPESIAELDKLIEFLDENPDIHIQINGHTDNFGDPHYNMELSDKRAGSVAAYLLGSSVKEERVRYAGFGETRPVASNETEEGRAENRRTEFEITSPYSD